MKRSTRTGLAAATVAAVAVALWLAGRSPIDAGGQAPPAGGRAGAVPVVVADAVRRDVALRHRFVGRSEAVATVTLRSRIDGQIDSIHFEPGATVRSGQLMFRLDQRMLEAELASAEANLSRRVAEANFARSELARHRELVQQGFVSRAQLESQRATLAAAEAQLHAERAAIDVARTRLAYASVHAPIDGVAGAVLAMAGNLVRANDTPLVVVNQVDPIRIGFSVPQSRLPQIRQAVARGPLSIEATLPGEPGGQALAGELVFIDNEVDASTGTIRLAAIAPNADRRLTPGQFVDVMLTVGELPDAVLVPGEALQIGQEGGFVWVVDAADTARPRPVEIRDVGSGMVAVLRGLEAGERVVTDGHLRLAPGVRVEARPASATAESALANGGVERR
jgi:membrane fusion protein, multidrug efflux system